jgi:hypothetical protein
MTALAIWLAVAGEPLFWAAAALFIGLFVYTIATTPRVLRNTEMMLAELERREEAQQVTR